MGSFDRTMKAPREKFDIETTGTIYIDQVDLPAAIPSSSRAWKRIRLRR